MEQDKERSLGDLIKGWDALTYEEKMKRRNDATKELFKNYKAETPYLDSLIDGSAFKNIPVPDENGMYKYTSPIAENTTNYCQVVPDSHRWTLYELISELKCLRNQLIPDNPTQTALLDYIIKGLQNSIDAGEDITKII